MATISSYYRFRVNINCSPGGYVEDYNLLLTPPQPPSTPYGPPSSGVKSVMLAILALRGILLAAGNYIANSVLSVETPVDDNPPEGYELPHYLSFGGPTALNIVGTSTLESAIPAPADPSQAISFFLNAGPYQENRTLRSLRSTWVQQWNVLQPLIASVNPAVPPTPTGVNAGPLIGQFMSYLRDNTALIQKNPADSTTFIQTPFLAPSAGPPPIIDPVVVGLTRRKIGDGWPKIKGRKSSFA